MDVQVSVKDRVLKSASDVFEAIIQPDVKRALGQTQGWTDFLCCLEAYLQFGVNLRDGRAKATY